MFFWDFFFYVLFGIVITFSTHHAGVLVVFAILVAPAALARRFFSTRAKQLLAAWAIGGIGVIGAFLVSYYLDWPTGAGIVAILTSCFFATLAVALVVERASN
jgi:zinc/manganese transport system permease protein